jgi:hypothetical protein
MTSFRRIEAHRRNARKRDRDDGVSRLVVSLDSGKADTILPELDRWATLIRQLGS